MVITNVIDCSAVAKRVTEIVFKERKWIQSTLDIVDTVSEENNIYTYKNNLFDALSKYFSDHSRDNGFLINRDFIEDFKKCLLECGFDEAIVKELAQSIYVALRDVIMEQYPEVYNQVLMSDVYQELKDKKIINNIPYKTIEELDKELKEITSNPQIGIDYFEVDDDDFSMDFEDALLNDSIYIEGKSREETIYRVLNELKRIGYEKDVCIVEDITAWEEISLSSINNRILVPIFLADSIHFIKNNKCIFIYDDDNKSNKSTKIRIRPRTRNNMIEGLKKAGMDHSDAFNLIESVNGLFVPFKNKVFKVANYKKPKWIDSNSESVLYAILFQKWTELDCDKKLIESFTGESYECFFSPLKNFLNSSQPLLLKKNYYGTIQWSLSCPDEIWLSLKDNIDDSLFESFLRFAKDTLKAFSYNTSICSKVFLEGILNTLMLFANINTNNDTCFKISSMMSSLMKEIETPFQLEKIAVFATNLVEISPEIFLQWLEESVLKEDGISALFMDSKESINYNNCYTYYLWAIELLLNIKELSIRTVNALVILGDGEPEHSYSNSAKSLLGNVLSPWINISAIDYDEKKFFVEKYICRYDYVWEIVLDIISHNNAIITYSNKFKYRKNEEEKPAFTDQVNDLYIKYLRLCVAWTKDSVVRWKPILSTLTKYENSIILEVFDVLNSSIIVMKDEEKIILKTKLRKIINRHRYFNDAEWSMSDDRIKIFEKKMNAIIMNNIVYDYLYCFMPIHDFPLLQPKPYSSDNFSQVENKNEAMINEEIDCKMTEFKKNNLSINELVNLAIIMSEKMNISLREVGRVLASNFDNYTFNEDTFKLILNSDYNGQIVDGYLLYIREENKSLIHKSLKLADENTVNKIVYVQILLKLRLDDYGINIVSNQSEDIKIEYWKYRQRIEENASKPSIMLILFELLQYGDLEHYLFTLTDIMDSLSDDELCTAVLKIKDVNNKLNTTKDLVDYEFRIIEKRLLSAYPVDSDKGDALSDVELLLRNNLEWETMIYTQFRMANNPEIFAEIVSYIYKQDNGVSSEEKKSLANEWYGFYHNAKFCPGEINGQVLLKDLEKWINDLEILLKNQNQIRLKDYLLGRLFSYSPIGHDGMMPCEAVREYMNKNFSEEMKNSYVIAEYNKRGVYFPNAGREEKEIAERYKENANKIRIVYPYVASVYDELSAYYLNQSEGERRRAENAF